MGTATIQLATEPELPASIPPTPAHARLFQVVFERLLHGDDADNDPQLEETKHVLVRLFQHALIEAEDIPIVAILAILLEKDDDSNFALSDEDELWKDAIGLLEYAAEFAPLDQIVTEMCETTVAIYDDPDDTDYENNHSKMLDIVAALCHSIDPAPFLALLADEDVHNRIAGLDACWKLKLSEPMIPLFDDPEEEVRRVAIEDACLVGMFSKPEIHARAEILRDTDPSEMIRAQCVTSLKAYADAKALSDKQVAEHQARMAAKAAESSIVTI